MSELPDGWSRVSSREIRVDDSSSVSPAETPDELFELYSVPSHATGRPELVRGRDVGSNKITVVPGTVLVCKINPRINRVWVVGDFSQCRKLASPEWVPFFPVAGINPEFLANYFRTHSFRNFLATNVSGVGGSLMRVRFETFASYAVPIAPENEQRRIVEEIDKQLTRLDAGVEALTRVQAQLKKYRASVLKAACEGRLVPTEAELARREKRDYEPAAQLLERVLRDENNTNHLALDPSSQPSLPIGWSWTVIGNIADVGTGATPNRSKSAYWSGGSIPWVTSAAAGLHIVRTAVEFVSETALRETNLTVYPAGTLILAMYGEGKTRGKCSVLGISAATNQALAAIVLSGHASDLRDWVRVFMAFNYENLRRQSSGGVQPNLNLGIVKRIAIPIPPLAEQRRIVQEVEDKLSVADAIAAQVERDLERAKRLRQSILSRAFAGELVPQDPNDEPASKLLERLKAEAPAAAPTRTRGKRQPKRAV